MSEKSGLARLNRMERACVCVRRIRRVGGSPNMDTNLLLRYNDFLLILRGCWMKYFLCLGSNSGDRSKNLDTALSRMKQRGLRILSCSALYETEPIGIPSETWFFNQVVEVDTDMRPSELLAWVKTTEKKMGRVLKEKLKSRVIDIDILLAEDCVIQTDGLHIPHPKLAMRNFVLFPFTEIAPDVIHPILKKKIRDLLLESEDSHQVKIINESR